jgi:hypothetical protein
MLQMALSTRIVVAVVVVINSLQGWGDTHAANDVLEFPPLLKELKVPIIPDNECEQMYPRQFFSQAMTCAGFREPGKDACQGDSGGPLVCVRDRSPFLVGVTSFGGTSTQWCAGTDKPGVYTDVANYITWIRSIIDRPPGATAAPRIMSWFNPSEELVIDWTLPPPGSQAQSRKALTDSTIKFVWSGLHNVYQLADEAAFDTCDFSSARLISGASPAVINAPPQGGTLYFACNIANHCDQNLKIKIDVPTKDGLFGLGNGWGAGVSADIRQKWNQLLNATQSKVEALCEKVGIDFISDSALCDPDNSKTVAIGVLAGGGVAALLFLSCIIYAVFRFCKKKKQADQSGNPAPQPASQEMQPIPQGRAHFQDIDASGSRQPATNWKQGALV